VRRAVAALALSAAYACLPPACAMPPEDEVIGGLPCDAGKCAPGYVCNLTTQRCVLAGSIDASSVGGSGGGEASGGAPPESGGARSTGGTGAAAGSGGSSGSGGAGGGRGGSGGAGTGGVALTDSGPDAPPEAAAPRCDDGVKNGDESAADCGGSSCQGCPVGAACRYALDCQSLSCPPRDAGKSLCAAPTCTDRAKNGTETDTDCGGGCAPCGNGAACSLAADCSSGQCIGLLCVAVTCSDGKKNGTESDVDCGGSSCAPCAAGRVCLAGIDCATGICNAMLQCAPATCTDGVKNGTETAKDCGGTACAKCAKNATCSVNGDCASNACLVGPFLLRYCN
jgi:hypothetical protein